MTDYPWPKIEPPHPDAVHHFVTEPPEPEPPTEDDLARLEWFCDVARAAGDETDVTWETGMVIAEVPRLIAELRRLRAENASLSDRYYDYDPSE